jgi:hypothetical protein
MNPLPAVDWLDEIINMEMSKRIRRALILQNCGEWDMAEEVFPDMPEFETQPVHEAA